MTTRKFNQNRTDVYVAKELPDFSVLGLPLQAFADENGKVVFSERGFARGFSLHKTWFRKHKHLLTAYRTPTQQGLQETNGTVGSASNEPRYLLTESSPTPISVVTMADLVESVSLIIDIEKDGVSKDRAVAMNQASFAVLLQLEVDKYCGVQRQPQEYTKPATKVRERVEQARSELKTISGKLTNPTFGATVYRHNNDLVFGEGRTRDTYEGDDRSFRLMMEGAVEVYQRAMKDAGLPHQDILAKSRSFFEGQLAKSTR